MVPHTKRHKEVVQNDADIRKSIPLEFMENVEAFGVLLSHIFFRQETGDFYRGKRCIWLRLAEFNTSVKARR
jgi:hypothetical protein